MTASSRITWTAIAGALWLWFSPGTLRAEPPDEPAEQPTELASDCPCAAKEPEAPSAAEPFEPAYILTLAAIPRVDGWDEVHGHRSGWGAAAGVDLSPWEAETEVHVELTYLSNRDDRLFSGDLGLKVPFHSGHEWDVHGVVGPSLAFDWQSVTLEDGEKHTHRAFVVGVIAGLGVAYWFQRHLGATLDVNYRVIGGDGISHRLFTALGMSARW